MLKGHAMSKDEICDDNNSKGVQSRIGAELLYVAEAKLISIRMRLL